MDEPVVHIEKLVHGGKGLSRDLQRVTFVPYTLPGEDVRIRIRKEKKDYSEGDPIEIVTPSKQRIAPDCRYFGKCGGCQLSHAGYETQVQLKETILRETLTRGRIQIPDVQVITGPPFGYRHRGQLKFNSSQRSIGFYELESHRIVDINQCLCLTPRLNDLLANLRKILLGNSLPSLTEIDLYEDDRGQTAAYFNADLPAELLHKLQELTQVFGPRDLEKSSLALHFREYSFPMRPDIFIQVNPRLWKAMVQEVESHYESDGKETAVELYCGTGFFTLPLSKKLKQIYACEENASAIKFVKTQPYPKNISWICSRAELLAFPPDTTVAIVDPPRSGLQKRILDRMIEQPLKKITYVSCDPSSFTRDLQILNGRYRLERLTMLDLFPQTYHMETIALLLPR